MTEAQMICGTNQRGMSRSELNRMLKWFPSWNGADESARQAFAYQARSVRYGEDALIGAWAWFLMGWKAAMEEVGSR